MDKMQIVFVSVCDAPAETTEHETSIRRRVFDVRVKYLVHPSPDHLSQSNLKRLREV